ncbi:MAG: protein kinase [Cyanobacteria bacterium SZAS TMP-1]|nr:protein kinase [Cyanobacteria bacterium SZAS TMP-1]
MPGGKDKTKGPRESAKETGIFSGSGGELVGKEIDRFEVVELLGQGSLSTAYKAWDKQNRTTVILKVVHKHLLSVIKNYKKFEQKVRQLINLDDPNIASYKDVMYVDGRVILISRPLIFESLEDLLSKTGHIGPERAVGIFIQVCKALEAAAQSDIQHRDLKPSNIVILDNQKYSDEIMVMDLGIAKIIAEENSDTRTDQYVTRTRETFGSPLYLSPEQCAGKKVDYRSDIYSLGCVIYESLTGKPPFVGKNVLETAYKHMNDTPRPLGLDPSLEPISTRFEEVVSKCLAKEPEARYQSAEELRNDLELLLGASDAEWATQAYIYRAAATKKKRGGGAGGGLRAYTPKTTISIESGIWGVGIVLLVGVVAYWCWIILKPENKKYPTLDPNMLWVVQIKAKPTPVEDFGNKEEAAKVNLQSIERDIGKNCREYADALLAIVQLYHESQHWTDALTYGKNLVQTTEQLEKDGQEGPAPMSECYRLVAYAAFNAGAYDEAVPAAERSLELAKNKAALNVNNIQCLRILGDLYSRKNNLPKACDIYLRFYNASQTEKEQHPNMFWDACTKLGDIYRRQNNLPEAEKYYKQGIEWWRSHGTPETPWAAKALYGYALILYTETKYKEAEEYIKEAVNLTRKGSNADPAIVGAVRKLYIDILWRTNVMDALAVQMGDPDKEK